MPQDDKITTDLPDRMILFGAYQWPTAPTKQALRRVLGELRSKVLASERNGDLAPEDLSPFSSEIPAEADLAFLRDHHAAMLDDYYLDWARDPQRGVERCVCVTRPSMPADLVSHWAESHGFDCLAVPEQIEDMGDLALKGDGLLVIPHLGQWFERRMGGLGAIRALLAALPRANRKVLACCNGWTWAFLDQAVNAGLCFRDARTFPAFDKTAMARIVRNSLDNAGTCRPVKSIQTGKDIFARDDDDELENGFFRKLAESSLACPWIALEQVANGLNEKHPDEKKDDAADDALWISSNWTTRLPDGLDSAALQVIHAILIHDALTPLQLDRVLAQPPDQLLLHALVDMRLIERDEGQLRCATWAYPGLRNHLATHGFPLDRL